MEALVAMLPVDSLTIEAGGHTQPDQGSRMHAVESYEDHRKGEGKESMGGSIRLGKILAIDIRLDYSWFVVFFVLVSLLATQLFSELHFSSGVSWILAVTATLLLFASVLVHEIAHCIVARRYGIEVTNITLFLFGGVAQIRGEPESPKAEFLIAGAGPAASLLIGVATLGLAWLASLGRGLTPAAALFNYLGVVNIALAVFNMAPGFPLDGGRIFRSAVWHFTGDLRKATRWASCSGQAIAWLLIGYGLLIRVLLNGDLSGLWLVFIGWFLNNAARAAYQQLLFRQALSGIPVAAVTDHSLPVVDAAVQVADFARYWVSRGENTLYLVFREGRFTGVITTDDVGALDQTLWGVTSVGILARVPEEAQFVEDDQDCWNTLTHMVEREVPELLVLHDGRPEGVVSQEALLRLAVRRLRLGHPDARAKAVRRPSTFRARGWSP
jgi:Zn-dependent protease